MELKKYFIYLFALLAACSPKYKIQSVENEIIEVKANIDSTIFKIISPYKNSIKEKMKEVLCVSILEIKKGKPESLLGNLITDLCLNYADADICVMNNGGLRSSLPKGNITIEDIYKLMPFENELVILELDEESFFNLLDYIILREGEPFSGMMIRSTKELPVFKILTDKFINFKNGKKIRLLTSDYLANGGDDMWFLKDKEQYNVGIKLRDAIISYCSNTDTIHTQLDNRLIILNE